MVNMQKILLFRAQERIPKCSIGIETRLKTGYNMHVLNKDIYKTLKGEKTDERTNELCFKTINLYRCFELGTDRNIWF